MRAIATMLLLACMSPGYATPAGHAGHAGHTGTERGAPPAWTDLPLIEAVPGRDRAQAAFRLSNLESVAVKAYAPGRQAPLPEGLRFKTERQEWDVLVQGSRFNLQSSGVGNYHWLLARQETPESVKVASTVHYFSNPGPAPTAMLARPKSELEIVPEPLPREHNRYRENQEWVFKLRFQGKPLAGTTLRFASNAGSRTSFTSDAEGRALVRFPADVKPAQAHGGHGGRASNRFILALEHNALGRHYLTTFSYRYGEDASANKSLAWGSGFLALGGLLGLPLIVHRKEGKNG